VPAVDRTSDQSLRAKCSDQGSTKPVPPVRPSEFSSEKSCQEKEGTNQYSGANEPSRSCGEPVLSRRHGNNVLNPIQTLFVAGTTAGITDRQLLERFAAGRDEGAEAAFTALVD